MGRRPLCLAALLLVLWTAVSGQTGARKEPLPLQELQGCTVAVQGQVYRLEKKKEKNLIYLKNISVSHYKKSKALSEYYSKTIVYTTEENTFQIGNVVQAQGKCTIPEAPTNPGQFDMPAYYRAQGIGFTLQRATALLTDDHVHLLLQTLHEIRGRLAESIRSIANEQDAALMCAVLLGDRTGLDEETLSLYRDGGISHIFSISGLHISMLGMLLFGLFRKAGMKYGVSALASMSVMLSYCLMTGASSSAVRAFLMYLVYLGAQAAGRTYDMKNGLALAVLCLLMGNGELLSQGGFQLSVLAVFGIAWISPLLQRVCGGGRKRREAFLVSLGVQLAILPCLLYHFFEFPPFGIVLNLLVLPFMSLAVMMGLAACLGGLLFAPAGVLLFAPCHYILAWYEVLCARSREIPGWMQTWGRPQTASILLYVVCLAGFCWLLGRKRRAALAGPGAVLLLAAGVWMLSFHYREAFEITFLDVGQGDGIFWETDGGTAFLCDGGSSSVTEVGKYRIIPFLKYRGRNVLDYVFITHMDEDHVNGIEELLGQEIGGIDIGHLVLPDLETRDERFGKIEKMAQRRGIPLIYLRRGMVIQAGDLSVKCLYPEKGNAGEEKNESSVVLRLEYQKFSALLTGDLEGRGEETVMKTGGDSVTLLKVAHHGSSNSSGEEFLRTFRPGISVISCGRGNTYGHPHAEVLERLAGSMILRTDQDGAVTVSTDGENYFVEKFE
jgi:competence protein ComEC